MNYFNYFSQYSGQKKAEQGVNKMLVILLIVVAVAACALVYGYYAIVGARYESQMEFLEEIGSNAGFLAQYDVAIEVSGQIDDADKEKNYMELFDEFTRTISTANRKLMALLDSCMVDGTKIKYIDINENNVKVDGYVKSINEVTAVERNLRASEAFSNVLVKTIENFVNDDTGKVEFYCELTLNGGAVLDESTED